MLTISSRIEVYPSVYYEDDGMRTFDVTKAPIGWKINTGSYYSDGEYGTVTADNALNGKCDGAIDKIVDFDSSDYRYCIVRCTSLTADNFRICAYYGGGSSIENTHSTSGLSTLDMDSYGGMVDTLRLYVYGDSDETAVFDYMVICNRVKREIFASEVETNQVVSGGFNSAIFKYDYADSLPLLNSHVKIWIQKNGGMKKTFTGITKVNREIHDGKTPKWHETECSGYGKYLYDRKYKGGLTESADEVINTITTSLRNEGLITTYNVTDTAISIKIRSEKGGRLIGDILEDDVCQPQNKIDWDFRVDFGKDLHAYPKGTRTQSINVGTHALSFNYEKDSEKIINTIEIYGDLGKILTTDASCTEDTLHWNSTYGDLVKDGTDYSIGDFSIRGDGSSLGIYLERTFSPVLDLSSGGRLYTKMRVLCGLFAHGTLDYTIYYKTDSSNYFTYSVLQGGGVMTKDFAQYQVPKGWLYDWFQLTSPITEYRAVDDFGIEGEPDWSNIKVIGFGINAPLPTPEFTGGHLWIDGLTIKVRYHGFYKDTTSISSFGIREGIIPPRPNLTSDTSCTIASSLVVTGYKDPLINVMNLVTSRNFDATIGNRVGFNIGDLDTSIDLRNITQSLQNFELETELALSNRYIPSVDKMLSVFQKQLELLNYDVEAWRNIHQAGAIIRSREALVDWWNQDPKAIAYGWILSGSKYYDMPSTVFTSYYESNAACDREYTNYHWHLITGADASYCQMWQANRLSPANTVGFNALIEVTNTQNVSFYIQMADKTDWVHVHYGFYIDNSTINAYSCFSRSGQENNIGTIVADTEVRLSAVYYPAQRIEYYVDDVYMCSLPVDDWTSSLGFYWFLWEAHNLTDANMTTLKIKDYRAMEIL